MIADEPTGALDSVNTKEVLELLEQIAQEGKLVIVVTHILKQLQTTAHVFYTWRVVK